MVLAIAKLLDEDEHRLLGTAFAVSRIYALTAFHCIGGRNGQVWRKRVLLELMTGERLAASFEAGSHVEDYAILALDALLPESLTPVPLRSRAYPNQAFRAGGYPSSVFQDDGTARQDIHFIGGQVRAGDTFIFGGSPAIQLYSSEMAAGQSLHGMSGGPVLVGQNPEGAVGLVRWNNPRKDAPELGEGGSFWACPTHLIARRHPQLAGIAIAVDSYGELLQETSLIERAGRFPDSHPLPINILVVTSQPDVENKLDVENERSVVQDSVAKLLIESRLAGKFRVRLDQLASVDQARAVLWSKGDGQGAAEPQTLNLNSYDLIILIIWHDLGPDNLAATIYDRARSLAQSEEQGARLFVFYKEDGLPPKYDPQHGASYFRLLQARDEVYRFYSSNVRESRRHFHVYEGQDFELYFLAALREKLRLLIEHHAQELRRGGRLAETHMAPDIAERNPFKGLAPYTMQDGALFFGRINEVDELRDKVADNGDHFLAVIGASGSGKSSIVRAGLFHRLSLGAIPGSQHWKIVEIRLGDRDAYGRHYAPLLATAVALLTAANELKSGGQPGLPYEYPYKLHEELARSFAQGTTAALLASIAAGLMPGKPSTARLVLFYDQFEEIFTLLGDEEEHKQQRKELMRFIAQAAATPCMHVVIAMRSDFYHRCIEYEELNALFKAGTCPLATPSPNAMLGIITRPAIYNGFSFEDRLPAQILQDAGDSSGSLPLVSYTLQELVKRALQENRTTLTAHDYSALGGVSGIIQQAADDAILELKSRRGFDFATNFKAVFRNLITVDDGGTATKRPALLAEIPPAAHAIVDALVARRLLQTDKAEDPGRGTVVQIAHEALLQNWDELQQWIQTMKGSLFILNKVKLEAARWRLARGTRQGQDEKPAAASGWRATTLQDVEVDRRLLWSHEELQGVQESLQNLGIDSDELEEEVQAFIRPEAERIVAELEVERVDHARRAQIGERLAQIGDPRLGTGLNGHGLPDIIWCKVPAAVTQIRIAGGSGVEPRVVEKAVEKPFYIAKYPITVCQFRAFAGSIEADDAVYKADTWWKDLGDDHARWFKNRPVPQLPDVPNHPANYISWYQAIAYCRWLTAQLQEKHLLDATCRIRLPAEWEWQVAATGGLEDYVYPWGSAWDATKANNKEGVYRLMAAGMYPHGKSPVGTMDMSGNIYEWCLNAYDDLDNLREGGDEPRVTKGGAYFHFPFLGPEVRDGLTVHSRLRDNASGFNNLGVRITAGFRPACDEPPAGATVEINDALFSAFGLPQAGEARPVRSPARP